MFTECQMPILGCSDFAYPSELLFGLCTDTKDNVLIEIPKEFPFGGYWGIPNTIIIDEFESLKYNIDLKLKIAWLSIREQLFYIYEGILEIPQDLHNYDKRIVIGMAPKGGLAIWMQDDKKSVLLQWTHGKQVDIPSSLFRTVSSGNSIKEICENYIKKIEQSGLALYDYMSFDFDKRMRLYNLRYSVKSIIKKCSIENTTKNLNICEDEFISQNLKLYNFDGTYNKAGNILDTYKFSGIPQKINLNWKHKGTDYFAFWNVEENIFDFWSRFWGMHPETKTDFIIRIDAENKKYELALYRQGLKEPVVIPESAYQLIVFKNKFEDYRSENYNQPRGAWIW